VHSWFRPTVGAGEFESYQIQMSIVDGGQRKRLIDARDPLTLDIVAKPQEQESRGRELTPIIMAFFRFQISDTSHETSGAQAANAPRQLFR
jgi:hypothetical protein